MNERKCCRLCAGKRALIDVFNPQDKRFIEIIKTSTNIEIKRNDKLSKKVCKSCKEGLEIGYKLRTLGKSNKDKLQESDSDSEEASIDVEMEDQEGNEEDIEVEEEDNEDIDVDEDENEDLEVEIEDDEENIEVNEEEEAIDDDEAAMEEHEKEDVMEEDEEEEKEDEDCIEAESEVDFSVDEDEECSEYEPSDDENDSLDGNVTDEEIIDEGDDYGESKEVEVELEDPLNCDYDEACEEAFKRGQITRKLNDARRKEAEFSLSELEANVFSNDIDQNMLIEYHKRVVERPTGWKTLMDRKIVGRHTIYKCKLCGQDHFYGLQKFIDHTVTHTGERSFKCHVPGCSKNYGTWRILSFHLQTAHCNNTVHCKICNTSFNHKFNLKKHIDRHKESGSKTIVRRNRPREKEKYKDKDEDEYTIEKTEEEKLIDYHRHLRKRQTSWEDILIHKKENGVEKFECKVCGRDKFSKLGNFTRHALLHTQEKSFICRVPGCKNAFLTWFKLKVHLKDHLDLGNFVCDICEASFNNKAAFVSHCEIHDFKKERKVKKEKKEVKVKKEKKAIQKLKREITQKIVIKKERVKCRYCSATYGDENGRDEHEKQHNPGNEVLVSCNFCEAFFLNKMLRSLHLRNKHPEMLASLGDETWYFCDICDKSFKKKHNLQSHILNHENIRDFKCQYCSGAFLKKFTRDRHEKLHRPGNEILLQCDQCESSFLGAQLFSIHLKREHDSKYGAKHRAQFSIAKKTHNPENEVLYQCHVCETSFDFPHLLSHHLKTEHGPKYEIKQEEKKKTIRRRRRKPEPEVPYHCDHCDQSFMGPTLLSLHLKTEHADKCEKEDEPTASITRRIYDCDICLKSFISRNGIRLHKKLHEANKNKFKCQYCPRIFKLESDRDKHEVTHKPQRCELCNFVATTATISMKVHLKSRHGVIVEEIPEIKDEQ
ncbi:hypothetical protein ACFFRR_002309 [Megaselia abdita]